ncbi:hypothetical protein SASPL_131677 [Salvia splendens]|uniref:Uncharacterized protein n=1 Tax=Salvia splendens TaxID=180675 RepID=A0A8X8ZLT4_SALSN|nr:hypothetical protein SASPL_131677 [Salvia splendens]
MFNTILAQLPTFSVQQASSMNTRLFHSFHIPLASLQSIPSLSSPLLSTFSMISAAAPRRAQATQHLRSFTLLVVAGAAVCDIRGVGDAHGGGPAGVLLQAAAAGGGDAGVVDGDYLLILLVWVFSELGAGFACG